MHTHTLFGINILIQVNVCDQQFKTQNILFAMFVTYI